MTILKFNNGILLFLFVLMPILEIWLLVKVGTIIGMMNLVLVIIITMLMGIFLMRFQGYWTFSNIQKGFQKGVVPSVEIVDNVLIFVGSIFLISPGLIADALGVILIFPITRWMLQILIIRLLSRGVKPSKIIDIQGSSSDFDKKNFDQNFLKY